MGPFLPLKCDLSQGCLPHSTCSSSSLAFLSVPTCTLPVNSPSPRHEQSRTCADVDACPSLHSRTMSLTSHEQTALHFAQASVCFLPLGTNTENLMGSGPSMANLPIAHALISAGVLWGMGPATAQPARNDCFGPSPMRKHSCFWGHWVKQVPHSSKPKTSPSLRFGTAFQGSK